MLISDPVAVALITGVTSTVTTLATLAVTIITKRKVRDLDHTVKEQHRETRLSLAAALCRHPADLPLRSPFPEAKK